MNSHELSGLICATAEIHRLPVKLVQAIVQVESGGNPWAVRYESAFYAAYVKGRGHKVWHGCSRETEERMRATSFGPMQIMGQTARELGFDEPFLTALCAPLQGLEWGCRYLAKQIQRYGGDPESGVAAYNAGSATRGANGRWRNQAYVDKVRLEGGFA